MLNDKLASRKYIDLIFRATTKWAVWDPPQNEPKLGDFGRVDKHTGLFEKHGNILTDEKYQDCVEPADAPIDNSEDVMNITSTNAVSVDLDAGLALEAQVGNAEFKAGYSFGKEVGAVLTIYKARQISISLNVERLAEKLDGKSIVTSITVCPAYVLYLSSDTRAEFSLALLIEGSVPSSLFSTGPHAKTKWLTKRGAGLYREANKTVDTFTVLYKLYDIKKRGWLREGPGAEEGGTDILLPSRPPWTELNDEGEEISSASTTKFTLPVANPDEYE